MDPLDGLWEPLRPYARELMRYARSCYVTSGYRSPDYQAELYNRWLQLRQAGWSNEQIARTYGLYTPSRPGCSYHNYGLAFDVGGPVSEREYLGAIWNSWGGLWRPADSVHFQVNAGPICT